jgi:hypothetical protein
VPSIKTIAGLERDGLLKSSSKAAGIDAGDSTALAGAAVITVASASRTMNLGERIYLLVPIKAIRTVLIADMHSV